MAKEPGSLILIDLRRIDENVDCLISDVHELKTRVTGAEENLASVHRCLDRLELGVERIEKRLDLVDSHP